MNRRLTLALLLALPFLLGSKGCPKDCVKLAALRDTICSAEPNGAACEAARQAYADNCPLDPVPDPTPTPTPEPTPTPTPTPEPTPTPTPTPTPSLPVRFPLPDARVYMRNKSYGQGFDSTPRVEGDPELCSLLHGVHVTDCHFETPVLGTKRALYETLVLAGARHGQPLPTRGLCPVWQFRFAGGPPQPANDDHNAQASIDHCGDPVDRDDPQTPTRGDTLETLTGFEGEPKVCGLQRDEHGPLAGFFVIAHGKAEIRACPPLDTAGENCGPFRSFDH